MASKAVDKKDSFKRGGSRPAGQFLRGRAEAAGRAQEVVKAPSTPAKPRGVKGGSLKPTPVATGAAKKAPSLLSRASGVARGVAGRAGLIGAGVSALGALASSEKRPRGLGGKTVDEVGGKGSSLKSGPDTRDSPRRKVKAPTPAARPKPTKKVDSSDKMDLNKLTKAGVKAKQMNKMSREGLNKVYNRVVKDK
jgi:hypothetical protein